MAVPNPNTAKGRAVATVTHRRGDRPVRVSPIRWPTASSPSPNQYRARRGGDQVSGTQLTAPAEGEAACSPDATSRATAEDRDWCAEHEKDGEHRRLFLRWAPSAGLPGSPSPARSVLPVALVDLVHGATRLRVWSRATR